MHANGFSSSFNLMYAGSAGETVAAAASPSQPAVPGLRAQSCQAPAHNAAEAVQLSSGCNAAASAGQAAPASMPEPSAAKLASQTSARKRRRLSSPQASPVTKRRQKG